MKISVDFLFSHNHKIGSKLISWGTKELNTNQSPTPSHVALLVNNKWVFESTLTSGVRIISYKKWNEINTLIAQIPYTVPVSYADIKVQFKELKDKDYDYLGIIYFAYRILLHKMFHIPIPISNLLNSKNRYFCTEVIGRLTQTKCEMVSPTQLLKLLSGRKFH